MWSDSGGLGQVQAGQYSGYLFPMGPFFALGDLLGLPPWLVQRLWLGLLLALAAWGTVRLLDALLDRERGAAHLVAGLLVLLNPYVVVFANRTTVTLLGYAALPWLLLIVHRGVRDPPAVVAGGVRARAGASTGGGVNAAVTGWILLAPILLAAYEAAFGPGELARRGRLRGARGVARGARLAVVDRAGGGARALRPQLPPVHRGARLDLGHDEPERGLPPAGLLDRLPRGRLRRHAGAVPRHGRRPTCSTCRWSSPRSSCPHSRSPGSPSACAGATGRSSWRCSCSGCW